jgi:hypothetical protein
VNDQVGNCPDDADTGGDGDGNAASAAVFTGPVTLRLGPPRRVVALVDDTLVG